MKLLDPTYQFFVNFFKLITSRVSNVAPVPNETLMVGS
jgi:hypothetical protein